MRFAKLLSGFMVLTACGVPAGGGPGTVTDAGTVADAGTPALSTAGWTWVPIDGSMCASGARAGIALSGDGHTTQQLAIYLEGGGACWNQGTCVPSLLQFGPICDYGMICLYDGEGGTKPTATFVADADPFPADGQGRLPGVLNTISSTLFFKRDRPNNPFRDATFVYVPYCTGDMHSGNTTHEYQYKYQLADAPKTTTVHFAGSTNIDAYLAYLVAHYPNAKKIWLFGASAGGYGATIHFDRVRRAFPNAEVDLLADSSPYIDTVHWAQWRDTWHMQLPQGCGGECDAGYPGIIDRVITANATRRIALLSNDHDGIVSWFFYAAPGVGPVYAPPTGTFNTNLNGLLTRYDQSPNAKYFVVPGTGHVLAPSADTLKSGDAGVLLREWIDAWATPDAGWASTR